MRQRQWEKKRRRAAELEAKKEAARVAKMEAEVREQEEIAAHKKLLMEQQEDEHLRQKHVQRKEKIAEQRWDNQFDTLLARIKDQLQEDKKLEEIRIIIQNRIPSLQKLDWDSWISDPLNQKLADLDYEHAMEMFKRDNLLAYRRKPGRSKKRYPIDNYALVFTGNSAGATRAYDHVTTDFNPDNFDLNLGFTVSYWVRPAEVGSTMFAFGRKHNNNQRFVFGISKSNKIYIGTGGNKLEGTWSGGLTDNPSGQTAAELFPSLFDDGDLKTGNWLHFAVTYTDRTSTSEGSVARKVYLNGELIRSQNVNWSATGGGTGGMTFGARRTSGNQYDNGWACSLDEVAIYDTAKDSDWITGVYNGGTKYDHRRDGGNGLVGYWKFNEGRGITVNDRSGKGNHGTFADISGDTTAYPTWEKR
tara:strand:+ start:20057 stop:21307 length:1251 start_codon:yes stop_codon:yes gene_type:complete